MGTRKVRPDLNLAYQRLSFPTLLLWRAGAIPFVVYTNDVHRTIGSVIWHWRRLRSAGETPWARHSGEILTLYAEGHPLFSVVPLLILPLSVKITPWFGTGYLSWAPPPNGELPWRGQRWAARYRHCARGVNRLQEGTNSRVRIDYRDNTMEMTSTCWCKNNPYEPHWQNNYPRHQLYILLAAAYISKKYSDFIFKSDVLLL